MTKLSRSSGDPIADRRAQYADNHAKDGDYAAAAEVMAQAMELAPQWTAGWALLGGYHEKGGDVAAALSAWRQLEALDDLGEYGAQLKLAAHGACRADEGTAASYVEALFDQYAATFESMLVDRLGYQVPALLDALLVDAMVELGITQFADALDLGCGTGLMGQKLRAKAYRLEGIDLSAAMIAVTARKGLYDRLEKAEILAFLGRRVGKADLITAADVFIYCGALPPVLAAIAPAMAPGGVLAFSLEAHEGAEAVFLRPSLRYAHGVDAARQALSDAGLQIVRFERAILRWDRGAPIFGVLIVARQPD